MHRGKDIVIIKKASKGKTFWYFYYYFTDDGITFNKSGRYSTFIELDPDDEEKSKRKAYRAAKHLKYQKEQERHDTQTSDTFSVYTKNWFIWGKCPYTTAENKRGKKLSRSNTQSNRRILTKNILPEFKDKKLKEITTSEIEDWLFKLQKQGLSSRSINIYFNPLQLIFREALRLKHIDVNPCDNVRPMIESVKYRKILTMEEYNKLFKRNALHDVWKDQLIYFTMTYIAATCGVRMGELQALQNKHIDLNELKIGIFYSWVRNDKALGPVKGTKNQRRDSEEDEKGRVVPITQEIAQYLRKCQKVNPEGFIFSFMNGKQPVDHKAIGKFWKRALDTIGIEDTDYNARGLQFHSLRHFANSYFNDHFEQNLTMQVIGHTTEQMNLHYDHATEDRLDRIREAMEKMGIAKASD